MIFELDNLNAKSRNELIQWFNSNVTITYECPQEAEVEKYIETLYHWQIMNTLILDFDCQKYKGEYIFSYSSWNHDKPVTKVYLEKEFRRYLRLVWNGDIKVIPCRKN